MNGLVWIRERATGLYSPMNLGKGHVISGLMVKELPRNAVFSGEFEFDENGRVRLLSGKEDSKNDIAICPNCSRELLKTSTGCLHCRCGWASCDI